MSHKIYWILEKVKLITISSMHLELEYVQIFVYLGGPCSSRICKKKKKKNTLTHTSITVLYSRLHIRTHTPYIMTDDTVKYTVNMYLI